MRWVVVVVGAQSDLVAASFEAVEHGGVDDAGCRPSPAYRRVLPAPELAPAANLDFSTVLAGRPDHDGSADIAANIEHDAHGTTDAGVLEGFDHPL